MEGNKLENRRPFVCFKLVCTSQELLQNGLNIVVKGTPTKVL